MVTPSVLLLSNVAMHVGCNLPVDPKISVVETRGICYFSIAIIIKTFEKKTVSRYVIVIVYLLSVSNQSLHVFYIVFYEVLFIIMVNKSSRVTGYHSVELLSVFNLEVKATSCSIYIGIDPNNQICFPSTNRPDLGMNVTP